jgi:hypothetical protein
MPEGYERLRDALKRKGKSDEEAKSMAAAIWNSKHKDNPVTNKKHEMAAEQLDILHEMGLATRITPGGMLGMTYVKGYQGDDTKGAQTGHGKTAYKQGKKKKIKPAVEDSLWPSGQPKFNLEAQRFGVVLLGIPSDFYREAEQLLTDRLGRRIAKNSLNTQVKSALPSPLQKFPASPNPNPNAMNSMNESGPSLTEILDYLKKKYTPRLG